MAIETAEVAYQGNGALHGSLLSRETFCRIAVGRQAFRKLLKSKESAVLARLGYSPQEIPEIVPVFDLLALPHQPTEDKEGWDFSISTNEVSMDPYIRIKSPEVGMAGMEVYLNRDSQPIGGFAVMGRYLFEDEKKLSKLLKSEIPYSWDTHSDTLTPRLLRQIGMLPEVFLRREEGENNDVVYGVAHTNGSEDIAGRLREVSRNAETVLLGKVRR